MKKELEQIRLGNIADTNHEIFALLKQRYSPRTFREEKIKKGQLNQLFEAAQNELLIYESYLFNNQFSIPTLVQRELFLLAFLMLRLDVKNENFSRIASYYLKNEKVWSFQKFEFYDFFKLVFEKNRWQEFDELLRDRKFILANKLDQLVWAYGYR